jgi:hypothetical protein
MRSVSRAVYEWSQYERKPSLNGRCYGDIVVLRSERKCNVSHVMEIVAHVMEI